MHTHRWWLALAAALLTPWPGPHMDRYVPLGWVLLKAGGEAADAGFWMLAAVLLVVVWLAWLAVFSGAARLARRK